MTCKDCRHFTLNTDGLGTCNSGKVLAYSEEVPKDNVPKDSVVGGGYDGYRDWISVGPDFGCIHYQLAAHVVGANI